MPAKQGSIDDVCDCKTPCKECKCKSLDEKEVVLMIPTKDGTYLHRVYDERFPEWGGYTKEGMKKIFGDKYPLKSSDL